MPRFTFTDNPLPGVTCIAELVAFGNTPFDINPLKKELKSEALYVGAYPPPTALALKKPPL